MRIAIVPAVGVLALLCGEPAHAWGSLTTAASNTHGCLDRSAYAVLAGRPGFDASTFPKLDDVLDHEGVALSSSFTLEGHGPDADGATNYSDHYYNPNTTAGGAPEAARKWFVKLYMQRETAKAAAWAAHFVADMTVPYHVNGMYRKDLVGPFNSRIDPNTFMLDPGVVGQRAWLSNPVSGKQTPQLKAFYGSNWSWVAKTTVPGVHDNNWRIEAGRYLAKSNSFPKLDWFDPWYWNGTGPGFMAYGGSSHLVYEFAVSNCPIVPPRYDQLWPGNPVPRWGNPNGQMADTVAEYTKRVAKWTYEYTQRYIADPDLALTNGASAILTVWRASFSGLRVSMTQEPDPAPRKQGDPPVVLVRAKLENRSGETPEGVEAALAVISSGGACTHKEPQIVPVASLPPGGPRLFGLWHVSVFKAGACKLRIAAKGHFTKTPDLQVAWHDDIITAKLPEVQPEPKKEEPKPVPATVHQDTSSICPANKKICPGNVSDLDGNVACCPI
jgi:hypothetical protein